MDMLQCIDRKFDYPGAQLLLLSIRIAPATACVARIEHVRIDQTQLEFLAVGLRDAAGAVRPAPVQGRARVIVLSGEDADRVRVRDRRSASRCP